MEFLNEKLKVHFKDQDYTEENKNLMRLKQFSFVRGDEEEENKEGQPKE